MRTAIQSIRSSVIPRSCAAERPVPMVGVPLTSDDPALLPYAPTGPSTDPFGWRALSRQLGDELVAPGFGTLYERQIQQESGFSPNVAFGQRRLSAGAEGIAQLMPAYNAGLGRVRSLMNSHGADWERGLPAETKGYLLAIVGDSHPQIQMDPAEVAIFGGRGPGGVLTAPIDRVLTESISNNTLQLLAAQGATVRAPADGHVSAVQYGDEGTTVLIDHGNGWQSSLQGIGDLAFAVGDTVKRGEPLGVVAQPAGVGQGLLRFGISLDSLSLDPRLYLLRT